ncbi:hypothetical protein IFU23_14120 [Pantoea agglomerans]|uniref:hypothetical protein n=1 Tax=Enterobacter agglomerans TaxID=549 RepID=UPI0017869F16|nr:hypothetical protein [Pantoea agglomerans]MBD8159237.1 hypothetical protein [Pantoea agglomerans]MBD8230319.1 hypothetical protein [Pantoea agglomerans]
MALIDEFLYALGFQADLRGGQAFDEQLKRIGDHGDSTRHSLLSTITAANLLSHALQKGVEMAKEVGGEFIRTAKEMEDMKVTFESLYTTAAEGEQKFHWLVNFARANPVMGLEAAKEAFLSLKNNGVEPTAAAMKAMGDTMAAMPGIGYMLGKDVGEILEGRYAMGGAIAQAGIKLHRSSKGGETSYHGSYINREGQTIPIKLDISDANKTIEQLTKILDDRFGGTMDKHARTMTGLIARWGNDWQAFQMEVMDNHVFAALEDELFSLITQWEAWAKSPDAQVMLGLISRILTVIVDIIGEAIRLTGAVLGWFEKWMGSANGIAIILGSIFLASKWTAIIGLVAKLAAGFRDVAAALELVRDGEAVVAVLTTLIDPLTLIPVLITAAVAGVATLVTQWHKFQDGFTTGWLDTFFLYISDGIARMGALIDWLGGKARIGILNTLSLTPGGLTKQQQAEMDELHKQYGMTEGEFEDNAAAKNRKEHRDDRSRAGLLEKAHAARPDLNDPGLLLAYVKQSSPDDYNRLIAPMLAKAPEGKMTYSYPHPEQVGPTQQLAPQNVTWSIQSVIVQAENALGFTKSLSDEAAKHGDTLASSQLNFSLPAGMRP